MNADRDDIDVPDDSVVLVIHADGTVEVHASGGEDDELVPQHVLFAGACLIMAHQPQEVIGAFIDSMMEAAASSTG